MSFLLKMINATPNSPLPTFSPQPTGLVTPPAPADSKEPMMKPVVKKKLNLKMILGIVVVLFLLGGGGVGLYLSQQSQEIRQQASVAQPPDSGCVADDRCKGIGSCCSGRSTFVGTTSCPPDGNKCIAAPAQPINVTVKCCVNGKATSDISGADQAKAEANCRALSNSHVGSCVCVGGSSQCNEQYKKIAKCLNDGSAWQFTETPCGEAQKDDQNVPCASGYAKTVNCNSNQRKNENPSGSGCFKCVNKTSCYKTSNACAAATLASDEKTCSAKKGEYNTAKICTDHMAATIHTLIHAGEKCNDATNGCNCADGPDSVKDSQGKLKLIANGTSCSVKLCYSVDTGCASASKIASNKTTCVSLIGEFNDKTECQKTGVSTGCPTGTTKYSPDGDQSHLACKCNNNPAKSVGLGATDNKACFDSDKARCQNQLPFNGYDNAVSICNNSGGQWSDASCSCGASCSGMKGNWKAACTSNDTKYSGKSSELADYGNNSMTCCIPKGQQVGPCCLIGSNEYKSLCFESQRLFTPSSPSDCGGACTTENETKCINNNTTIKCFNKKWTFASSGCNKGTTPIGQCQKVDTDCATGSTAVNDMSCSNLKTVQPSVYTGKMCKANGTSGDDGDTDINPPPTIPGCDTVVWCTTWDCPNGDTDGDKQCTLADSGSSYVLGDGSSCGTPPSSCGQRDYYNAGPKGENWNAYCSHDSLNFDSCKPPDAPPASPPPDAKYSCNAPCKTDDQCQNEAKGGNSHFFCNTNNKCRLKANPESAKCKPAVAPMCISIAMNNVSNPTAPATADPKLGDNVTFTCGQVSAAERYIFKVIDPAGQTTNLVATGRVSAQFTITQSGKYFAQCQICTGSADSTCLPWESLQ